MGGTLLVHTSLMNGQIDVYPEYTGTALQAVLKLTMVNDPKATFDRVRELYRSNLKLEWLDPLGFDNSFVMLVRRDDPAFAKINTLSDAERYTEGWQLGVGYEFEQRPDGLSTLNTFYRLNQPKAPVTMDLGLLYKALSQRQVNMAAANSTDGPLAVEPVKILKDDRHCFPPYQASLVVRQEALQSYPELKAALDELSGKFPEAAIRKLNYEVDVKHASPKDVAAGFLHDSGLRR
jgi:glycine betaine/choline ABC-type transport system substrate-binding protein